MSTESRNGGRLGMFCLAAICASTAAAVTVWHIQILLEAGDLAPLALRAKTAALGMLTFLILRWSFSFWRRNPDSTAYGSAGFAKGEDTLDLILPEKERLSPGGVLLGCVGPKLLALPPLLARQHGIIVGGSGTGKSWGLFLPNVAHSRNTSCVVTDPKSELWRHTSGFHPSLRFAPAEPDESACFNWIPLCRHARIAELCARAIVEAGSTDRQEPPWPDLEVAFLSALFSHASTLEVPTPLSAYRLFTRTEPAALMDAFLTSASPAAQEQAVIFGQTHERMRGSIVPVIAAKLQFLRDPAIARFTSALLTPPDFGTLRLSPQALYWCVREQDITRLRPLSAVFFTLLLEQLAAGASQDDNSNAPGTRPCPVNIYLDEFANIGVIPHFETTISLARGRGVSLWLGIQSLSQLTARYGTANAQTILTNCATKIALSGLDVETAEYFSRSLGQATGRMSRRTWQKKRLALVSSSTSDTTHEHPRPLLTADEVRRIDAGSALVIVGNRRPLLLKKLVYDLPARACLTAALGPALSVSVELLKPKIKTERIPEDVPPLPPPSPPPFPEELKAPLAKKKASLHRFTLKRPNKGDGQRVTWIAKPKDDPLKPAGK